MLRHLRQSASLGPLQAWGCLDTCGVGPDPWPSLLLGADSGCGPLLGFRPIWAHLTKGDYREAYIQGAEGCPRPKPFMADIEQGTMNSAHS